MNDDNFLLGYGERLTQPMAPPPSKMEKHSPYTIPEAVQRLIPKFTTATTQLKQLPDTANPDGVTVAAVTLHPSFVAKSYYPEALLKELNLTPIGSKETRVKPDKWTRKEPTKEVRSTLIYVEGSIQAFDAVPEKLTSLGKTDSVASRDIVKIEKISALTAEEKIKDDLGSSEDVELEVALHLGDIDTQSKVLTGFKQHLENLGVEADIDGRVELDGMCFMPIKTDGAKAKKVAQYSFLRYARKMPYLLPIIRNVDGLSFNVDLPESRPIDPSMRVAVFDGGVPDNSILEPWVRHFEADGVGTPIDELLHHGTAVTGSVLFGPLQQGEPVPTPYCYVDHYRVLGDGNDDELSVIKRIRKVIEANNYKYVNFSLGPRIPIADDDINPWTAIIDKLLYQKEILATVATGNDGDLDEENGNARIQPPSDAVNALGIGSADRLDADDWQRAEYSSYGPGRAPGVIKPEIVAFGGSSREPLHVIDAFNGSTTSPTTGTSFASPLALRTALGIRAHFGEVLSPIALKALLVHAAIKEDAHEPKHCGWGRVPTDFHSIVSTNNTSVRVVYQGTLNPAEWMNVPIPLPAEDLQGMVNIKATLCYFTDTNPEDPVNYTKSGMEIRFRPHADKFEVRDGVQAMYPKSKSFFQKNQIDLFDDDLNYNAHFWETTLSATKRMRATSLKAPVFNLHYNARSSGRRAAADTPPLNYAMVITIDAPRNDSLYQDVVQHYRTQLEALQPVVQIPVVVG